MADQTDVANALVSMIASVVYPNGTAQPSIAPGAPPVLIYQGWPVSPKLDNDLKAGTMHVSVWPTPTERITESFASDQQTLSVNTPTIQIAVLGNRVTISGTGAAGQNSALLINGQPYVYSVQATDTAASIATALTAMLPAQLGATNVGAVITVPGARLIIGRVGVQGTSVRVLQRREKLYQVSVWANSFNTRDPLASAIDAALTDSVRLSMADGTQAIVRFRTSMQHDGSQKAGMYRRDMIFAVEYCVTNIVQLVQIVTEQTNVSVPLSSQQTTIYS